MSDYAHEDGAPAERGWPVAGPREAWIDVAARVVEHHQAEEVDGMLLDATTARAMCAVDQALSPENRARFRAMPLERAVTVTWRLVK